MRRLKRLTPLALSLTLWLNGCSSPETPTEPVLSGATGTGCVPGQLACAGACIDPNSHNANCGACGVTCVGSQSCVAGQCQCLVGLNDCGAGCTDTQSDPAHCGGCNVACALDQVCSLGQCSSTCAAGLSVCGQGCVDTQASPLHCGTCNTQCPVGQTCVGGSCSCVAGQIPCGDGCADVLTDVQHCGVCGNACPLGQSCSGGICTATTATATTGAALTSSNTLASSTSSGTTSSTTTSTTGMGATSGNTTGAITTGTSTNTAGTQTTGMPNTTGAGGATTTGTATSTSTTGGTLEVPYILGADISIIQEEEDKGITFVDGGTQKDILEILGDHGFNYIRLRLFHDPGAPGGYQTEFVTRAEPYCDLPHTIEMAQRVKAANMGFLLDFHYSDTWADPANQHKPAAWANLSFNELVTAVHDYTRDTLLAFQAAGALPDMVQVGNEITPGMLHPDGHTYEPNNWDQLAQLLIAGLSAVKEVNSGIQTMLHLDRGGDNETTVWWVGEALARNVQFDILGESAYTAFHGGPDVWEANFQDLATRYPDLKFVIAEYNGEKRAANDIMRALPNGRGLGTFFWEPTSNGEWGDSMVTWQGSSAVFNQADLAIYDQIADDYGLR